MLVHKTLLIIANAWPLILQGLGMTLAISVGALTIGLTCGTLVGMAMCDVLRTKLAYTLDAFVLLLRGTPVYVQVLIAYYVLPDVLGFNLTPTTAGLVALGANCTAYTAEIIRAGINTVPIGQWDGAQVLGYTRAQAAWYIIGPQALKNVLPAMVNEVTALIKESSVLAMIGVLELTKVALNLSAKTLDPLIVYASVALLYLCITGAVWFGAKKLELYLEGVL